MQSKLLHTADGLKTYALIFDEGDEAMGELRRFTEENNITGAQFTAIGAFRSVVVSYFDWPTKKYLHIPIDEQVEVLTLAGDVAEKDGKPAVHAHLVVGKSDGTAHGGHLVEAHVRPTLELVLTETPAHLCKQYDQRTGLSLIRL